MFGTFLHINLYTRPLKLHYEDLETIKSPQCLVHFYTLTYFTGRVYKLMCKNVPNIVGT